MKIPDLFSKVTVLLLSDKNPEPAHQRASNKPKAKSNLERTSKAVTVLMNRKLRHIKNMSLPKVGKDQIEKVGESAKEKFKSVQKRIPDMPEIKPDWERTSKAVMTLLRRKFKGRTTDKPKPDPTEQAETSAEKKPKPTHQRRPNRRRIKQIWMCCRLVRMVYYYFSRRWKAKFRPGRRPKDAIMKGGKNKTMKKDTLKQIGKWVVVAAPVLSDVLKDLLKKRQNKATEPTKQNRVIKQIGYLVAIVVLAVAVEFLAREGFGMAALLIAVIGGITVSLSWIIDRIDLNR